MSDSELVRLKNELNTLTAQKEIIEIESDAIFSELMNIGLNGQSPAGITNSLIDIEGFPRGDIDIYNVKNKRRRLRELNTGINGTICPQYLMELT